MGIDVTHTASEFPLPKLPSHAIHRTRIDAWLTDRSRNSVSFLVAPKGYGKTTVLLQTAHNYIGRVVYLRCIEGRGLRSSIEDRFSFNDLPINEILHHLEAYDLILLDNLEHMVDEDSLLLDCILKDEKIKNLICASSRYDIIDSTIITSGVISICTQRMLAFEVSEIIESGHLIGLTVGDLEAKDLLAKSDGWPLAIFGILRQAQSFGVTIDNGYETWKRDQRSIILGVVDSGIKLMSPPLQEAWDVLLEENRIPDRLLRNLESAGAHLVYDEALGLVPLRIIRDMRAVDISKISISPTMICRMFGIFECLIDGRSIEWDRRMDKRLFRYLLLTKTGGERREDILEKFWPGKDILSSTQSLRVTCSNIRRAISRVVGPDLVSSYFIYDETIRVNLENISVDVRRFLAHIKTANTSFITESFDDAIYHYRHAEKLYIAHLGWGDEPEEWLEALFIECRNLRMTSLQNMIVSLRNLKRTSEASEWEAVLVERTKRHRNELT